MKHEGFVAKNAARRSRRPEKGSRDRKQFNAARLRRRATGGAFGNLRAERTMDEYKELAFGTRGERWVG